ncbi:MAG: uncharacterized protein JWO82_3445 [Akkermansiaceae bacterium]|nr:uncharacterized protein [Akkermansiaceae bacterium]
MKSLLTALAALTVLAPLVQGATTFDFDGSDVATTTGTALGTTVTVQGAYWETLDDNGDPLATPGFRPDVTATVTAADPNVFGYGPAISGKAIDGTNGPLLFNFTVAQTISNFGITLDNSTFGNIPTTGGDPAFGTNILFYDAADNLIGFIPVDQTVSGFTVNDASTFANVSKIVLPSGAYYDNMNFTAVPEPAALALAGLGTLLAFVRRRTT